MRDRLAHRQDVLLFLQSAFPPADWALTVPAGTGHETYVARSADLALFIKLGTHAERAVAMASAGLSPPVLASGRLPGGTEIVVCPFVAGRTPSRRDFQANLDKFARAVGAMHRDPGVLASLAPSPSDSHRDLARDALARLRGRWQHVEPEVSSVAGFVREGLDRIAGAIEGFSTRGLAASHNDICNANWLILDDGSLYIIDLEAMSREDPACDLGAILWWYYTPALRARFLDVAGYEYTPELTTRMRLRMAMHCLAITLPREGSFDRFDPLTYPARLDDFRAILNGEENPQGYA